MARWRQAPAVETDEEPQWKRAPAVAPAGPFANGNVDEFGGTAGLRSLAQGAGALGRIGRSPIVSQALSGVNEGIANIAGAPVDLAAGALDLVTGGRARFGERPLGGSRALKEALAGAGATGPAADPSQRGQRYARSVGRNVAEGLAVLAPVGAAGRVKSVAEAAKKGSIPAQIAAGVAQRPAAAGALETGAGALAGVGGETLDPRGDDPTMRAIGEIAGGVAGPGALAGAAKIAGKVSPTTYLARAATSAVPAVARKRAGDLARKTLGEQVTPDMIAETQRTGRLADEMGLDLTLAERTNAPALKATQRAIERGAEGAKLGRLVSRHEGNREAIDRFAQMRAPRATEGPEAVERAVLRSQERAEQAVDRMLARQRRRAEGLAGRLFAGDEARAAKGRAIREAIIDARAQKQAEMSALADDLGLNDNLDLPFDQAARTLVSEFGALRRFDKAASRPAIVDELDAFVKSADAAPTSAGGPGGKITFADWQSLSQRLADDARAALGAATPDYQLARTLGRMRDRVEELADSVFAAASPEALENYRLFKDRYRTEFAELYRQGPLYEATKRTPRGDFLTADEVVASRFFAPGSITAARKFKAAVGDARANELLEIPVFGDLAHSVVDGGVISARKLGAWRARHREILKEFPEIDRRIGASADAAAEIQKVSALLAERRKELGETILARKARALAGGARGIDEVIAEAVRRPQTMAALRKAVANDPAAREALKRHIWDGVASAEPKDILGYLNENRASLRQALGNTHMADLEKIAQARDMIARVGPPAGAGGLENDLKALEAFAGVGLPQIMSRIFAVKSGRTSARYIAVELFQRFAYATNSREFRRVVEKALYDPDIARDLRILLYAPDAAARKAIPRLRGYLIQDGDILATENQEE